MEEDKAINELRKQIDGLDARLLELLNERAQHAIAIGRLKKEHDAAAEVYRPAREAQAVVYGECRDSV